MKSCSKERNDNMKKFLALPEDLNKKDYNNGDFVQAFNLHYLKILDNPPLLVGSIHADVLNREVKNDFGTFVLCQSHYLSDDDDYTIKIFQKRANENHPYEIIGIANDIEGYIPRWYYDKIFIIKDKVNGRTFGLSFDETWELLYQKGANNAEAYSENIPIGISRLTVDNQIMEALNHYYSHEILRNHGYFMGAIKVFSTTHKGTQYTFIYCGPLINCHFEEQDQFNPIEDLNKMLNSEETFKIISHFEVDRATVIYENSDIEDDELYDDDLDFEDEELCEDDIDIEDEELCADLDHVLNTPNKSIAINDKKHKHQIYLVTKSTGIFEKDDLAKCEALKLLNLEDSNAITKEFYTFANKNIDHIRSLPHWDSKYWKVSVKKHPDIEFSNQAKEEIERNRQGG
jgi:hypothetical protein